MKFILYKNDVQKSCFFNDDDLKKYINDIKKNKNDFYINLYLAGVNINDLPKNNKDDIYAYYNIPCIIFKRKIKNTKYCNLSFLFIDDFYQCIDICNNIYN